jgi:hypothetical protein
MVRRDLVWLIIALINIRIRTISSIGEISGPFLIRHVEVTVELIVGIAHIISGIIGNVVKIPHSRREI